MATVGQYKCEACGESFSTREELNGTCEGPFSNRCSIQVSNLRNDIQDTTGTDGTSQDPQALESH
jgi:hypothetical protein